MGLFKKKIRELEEGQNAEVMNLAQATSDTASNIIRELSGKDTKTGYKLVDNLICFSNASGGTGASTIASNVAYVATQRGLRVCLVDLNIICPIQHAYLGIKQELDRPDLISYLLGQNLLSESIISSKGKVNLIYANNRTIIDEINCNDKVSIDNFTQMLYKLRDFYDLVILDCPMRIDTLIHNVALYNSDFIYTVWDEGAASQINTEKLRRSMSLTGIDGYTKIKAVLNKRTSVHFSKYPFEKLNIECVEILPFDIDIIENSTKGRIFCEKGSSNSKNAITFAERIDSLTDKILKISGYIDTKKKEEALDE